MLEGLTIFASKSLDNEGLCIVMLFDFVNMYISETKIYYNYMMNFIEPYQN